MKKGCPLRDSLFFVTCTPIPRPTENGRILKHGAETVRIELKNA